MPCSSPARAEPARKSSHAPSTKRGARQGRSSASTAGPSPSTCSRASSSVTCAAPSPARTATARACSARLEGGTRAARRDRRDAPEDAGRALARPAGKEVRPSAAPARSRWTCVFSSPPTAISGEMVERRLPRGPVLPHPRGRDPAAALRERIEDIPLLVDHFLRLFAARYKRERSGSRATPCGADGVSLAGQRASARARPAQRLDAERQPELEAEDFDIPDGRPPNSRAIAPGTWPRPTENRKTKRRAPRARAASRRRRSTISQHRKDERDPILKALQACNWNRVKAAELQRYPAPHVPPPPPRIRHPVRARERNSSALVHVPNSFFLFFFFFFFNRGPALPRDATKSKEAAPGAPATSTRAASQASRPELADATNPPKPLAVGDEAPDFEGLVPHTGARVRLVGPGSTSPSPSSSTRGTKRPRPHWGRPRLDSRRLARAEPSASCRWCWGSRWIRKRRTPRVRNGWRRAAVPSDDRLRVALLCPRVRRRDRNRRPDGLVDRGRSRTRKVLRLCPREPRPSRLTRAKPILRDALKALQVTGAAVIFSWRSFLCRPSRVMPSDLAALVLLLPCSRRASRG